MNSKETTVQFLYGGFFVIEDVEVPPDIMKVREKT